MSLHEVLMLLFVGLAQAAGSNQAWPGTMAKEMHGSFVAYHMHQKRFEIYTDNFESDYFSFISVYSNIFTQYIDIEIHSCNF